MSKAKAIRDCLEKFWDKQMGDPSEEPLFPVGSEMDSLTAVRVLLEVEEILGSKDLPQTLVRKGGYESKADFVDTLSANVAKHCESL